MSNRPKQKGTAAETAAVKWFREHGFPWTERLTLTGSSDRGDLSLLPGALVVVEVKNTKAGATGQPPAGQLAKWMRETEAERVNAGADHAALIVKRAGTTDVGRWFCYLPLGHLVELSQWDEPFPAAAYRTPYDQPACITPEAWAHMLRVAGYGHPHEGDDNP